MPCVLKQDKKNIKIILKEIPEELICILQQDDGSRQEGIRSKTTTTLGFNEGNQELLERNGAFLWGWG